MQSAWLLNSRLFEVEIKKDVPSNSSALEPLLPIGKGLCIVDVGTYPLYENNAEGIQFAKYVMCFSRHAY